MARKWEVEKRGLDDDDSRLAAGMDGTTLRNGTRRERESEGTQGGREGGWPLNESEKPSFLEDDVTLLTFLVNIKEGNI